MSPLRKYFPDYSSGDDVNKARSLILQQFVKANRANLEIYAWFVQHTDMPSLCRFFSATISDTIISANMGFH